MPRRPTSSEPEDASPERARSNADWVSVPKVADVVASRIRREIVTGELREGENLAPERMLTARFGVSRPTLREAIRILESESLISTKRGSRGGAQVHAPNPATVARHAGFCLQHRGTTLEDVQAARIVIEPPAARALAQRRDAQACERLRRSIEEEKAALDDPDRFGALTTRFHELVMECAGNETLALMFQTLSEIIDRHVESSMSVYSNPKQARKAIRSKEKLVELIEAGDEEGAEAHWRRHVQNASEVLLDRAGRKRVVDLFE